MKVWLSNLPCTRGKGENRDNSCRSEGNNGDRGAEVRKSRPLCKKTRMSRIGERDTSGRDGKRSKREEIGDL